MAPMPSAAAAPVMPTDDTDAAAPGADMGAEDQGGDDQGTPICTIMGHSDGTFSLVKGDEDDAEEGAEGAAPAPGAAGGDEGSEDQAQSFTDIGSLLKGVMQSVKEFQAESGGSSDQQNFEAGFAGSDTSGPGAPPSPAPKA